MVDTPPAISPERWTRLLHTLDAEHPPRDMSLYVEPLRSSASIIATEFIHQPRANRKFLLVGARGGGKSTELRRIEQLIAEHATLVTVDLGATGVNPGTVSAFDLLYISALAVLAKLPDVGARDPLFEALRKAYGGDQADRLGDLTTALDGVVSFAGATAAAAASVGAVASGAAAIGAVVAVAGQGIRLLTGRHSSVVDQATPQGRALQGACVNIARAVRDAYTGKPICLLIDGLEKINGEGDERFQQVFCYTRLLLDTEWSAAIAAPPSTLTQNSPAEALGYRSLPVYGFDPTSDKLHDVLRNRFQAEGIDPAHAIDDSSLAEIATQSGGLPRHAVRMTQHAVRAALEAKAPRLSPEHVSAGIRTFGESLGMGLNLEDLRILGVVMKTRRLPGDEGAPRLFANGRILAHPPRPDSTLPEFVVHPVLRADVEASIGE